jgi:hypothetical protein
MRYNLYFGVLLLGIGTTVQADILAGGAIFGGFNQQLAVCYLYNAGGSTVTVTSNSIVQQGVATPLVLNFDNCGTLAAGATCVIQAPIVNNLAHSCRMVVTPSGSDVRGNFDVRTTAGVILNNSELR